MFSYNIILIGFMGTGKSTVSKYLNQTYGMRIIETDEIIVQREGLRIPEIFSRFGEEYFRNLETSLLTEMQAMQNAVISCGGGAALRERNVIEMKKSGKVVLLTATPETILERVKEDEERPLLKGNKNTAFIADLIEKRREKYENAADVIISTDGKSAAEIGEEIIASLR